MSPTPGSLLPAWIRNYQRSDLGTDLIAGLTVAALLVPQSMAYASAAGFPPVLGLYSSVVPLLVYAIGGRSGILAIGPLVGMNLVASSGIARFAGTDSREFVAAAATVTLLVGLVHLGVRLVRAHRWVAKVSPVTLDGFLLAIAIVVIVLQLDDLLGLADRHRGTVDTLALVVEQIGAAQLIGLGIGVATIAFLLATHRYARLPAALIAILLGGGATWALGLGSDQVHTLGAIPGGLPVPSLPTTDHLVGLIPTALACTLLSLIEVSALVRRFENSDELPGSEVATLGIANLAASVFRGLPVTSVPTRTAVAAAAGARTQLTGVVASLVTLALLVLGTAALAYLPLPTLAAVAIVAALSFFRLPTWRALWHDDRRRFAIGITVTVVCVVLGFEIGAVAVVLMSVVDHLTTRSPADAATDAPR